MLNEQEKSKNENAVTPAKPRKRASAAEGAPTAVKSTKKPVAAKKTTTAARSTKTKATSASALSTAAQEVTREEIAQVAYLLWESRGRTSGSPEGDWLTAEALLRERGTTIS